MFTRSVLRSGVVAVRSAALRNYAPRWVPARFESNSAPQLTKEQILRKKELELANQWIPPIVTYEQVKPMTLQPSPDSYLIDVREPDEVIQGSIPSSVNLPLSVLSGSLHLPAEEFKVKFGFNKPKRDQEIVFYCRSGVRAATAGDAAKKNGYTNISNYKGSWLEWVQKEGNKAPSS